MFWDKISGNSVMRKFCHSLKEGMKEYVALKSSQELHQAIDLDYLNSIPLTAVDVLLDPN